MFKIIAVLLALTSLLTAKDDSVNYWENDGIVAIEIETVPCEKSWQKETSMKGFTGECYYTWKGANKLIFLVNISPKIIEYVFRVRKKWSG